MIGLIYADTRRRLARKNIPREVQPLLVKITMHSRLTLNSMAKALKKHNVNYYKAEIGDWFHDCDYAILWGYRRVVGYDGKLRWRFLDKLAKKKIRPMIIELGYLRRYSMWGSGYNADGESYFGVGWDGLNGRADFCNKDCPPDRFEKLGIPIKPWRENGDHILVCGQAYYDSSLFHLLRRPETKDKFFEMQGTGFPYGSLYIDWIIETLKKIRKHSDRKIVFRHHPKIGKLYKNTPVFSYCSGAIKHCGVENVEISPMGGPTGNIRNVNEDYKNCWAVVCFNSNSGVEATLNGIPTFVGDVGSMAWDVADKDLSKIENPSYKERDQWAHNLAYCQWTVNEMKQGLPLKHLGVL